MTGDRSRLMNFVSKFIGTVRFGNDHFGAIMGYGDYAVRKSVISRVYYVEGLGHNFFSVGQFCDSDLAVEHRQEWITGYLGSPCKNGFHLVSNSDWTTHIRSEEHTSELQSRI